MITTNSKLPNGAVMYLPEHPGNIYRNLHKGEAEFIEHRLGPQYRGCKVQLGIDRVVATSPEDTLPEECMICGDPVLHPDDNAFLCRQCAYEQDQGDEFDTTLL